MSACGNPNQLATRDRGFKALGIFRPQNLIVFAPQNQGWASNLTDLVAQKVIATTFGKRNNRFTPAIAGKV